MLEPDEVDLLNIVELRRELRHALQWRTDKVAELAAMNDENDTTLKPCPCCGSNAFFDMIEGDPLIDTSVGGWFIECSNAECRITTQLRFEAGDDPHISLSEIWNKRNGDEDE
jgi:hypothetical protein